MLVNSDAVRSCLMFAVQADGAEVTTLEGLAPEGGPLTPVQQGFMESMDSSAGSARPDSWRPLTRFCAITQTHRG